MAGLVRYSLNRIVPTLRSNVLQKATIVSGPPRNPVPFTTKLAVGGVMCGIIITPMFYIMANIKHYKNPNGVASS